jgi:hypothetical protein
VIDKESLKIKMLAQVLIDKVGQLFRNLLERKFAQSAAGERPKFLSFRAATPSTRTAEPGDG